jgi:hypothetical protein
MSARAIHPNLRKYLLRQWRASTTMDTSRHLIFVTTVILGAVVGFAYSTLVEGTPSTGAITGAAICACLMGFELYVVQTQHGRGLRWLPLPVFALLTGLNWLGLVALCLSVIPLVLHGHSYGRDYVETTFGQDLAFSILVALVFNAALRIRLLVRSRVLGNFLIGRYYRPLRED